MSNLMTGLFADMIFLVITAVIVLTVVPFFIPIGVNRLKASTSNNGREIFRFLLLNRFPRLNRGNRIRGDLRIAEFQIISGTIFMCAPFFAFRAAGFWIEYDIIAFLTCIGLVLSSLIVYAILDMAVSVFDFLNYSVRLYRIKLDWQNWFMPLYIFAAFCFWVIVAIVFYFGSFVDLIEGLVWQLFWMLAGV